jgi:NADPH-dependent 2,4-dienoyl-CoA reductase/sulfur reductase-like enzyme
VNIRETDIAVIGGGPAGLAAALEACRLGAERVTVFERDFEPGGILPQCIHDGFGVIQFNEMLTGPEYAQRYIDRLAHTNVEMRLNTIVLNVTPDRLITVSSPEGLEKYRAGAVVLAMGCRERTRSQILIPGDRPAGVFTAGTAQRMINIEGLHVGKKIVVLGSGDIGMIMARRLTLEGARVVGLYEILPEPGGLTRNVVQCLHDYDIPLYLRSTVTGIYGKKRVESVAVAEVDDDLKPLPHTRQLILCDTLLLSVGLIPENELSRRIGLTIDPVTGGPIVSGCMAASIPGFFACGNVVHVNDLVDYVSESAEIAARGALSFISGMERPQRIPVRRGENVRYVVPQFVEEDPSLHGSTLYIRVQRSMKRMILQAKAGDKLLMKKAVPAVRPPEMLHLTLPPLDETVEEIQIDVVPQEHTND